MHVHNVFFKGLSGVFFLSLAIGCVAPDERSVGNQNELRSGRDVTKNLPPLTFAMLDVLDLTQSTNRLYFSGIWITPHVVLTSGSELYEFQRRVEGDPLHFGMEVARLYVNPRERETYTARCNPRLDDRSCKIGIYSPLLDCLKGQPLAKQPFPADIGLLFVKNADNQQFADEKNQRLVDVYPTLGQGEDEGQASGGRTVDVVGRREEPKTTNKPRYFVDNHVILESSFRLEPADGFFQHYYQANPEPSCWFDFKLTPALQSWDAGGPVLFQTKQGDVHLLGVSSWMASSPPPENRSRDRLVKLTPALIEWITTWIADNVPGDPRPLQ